MHAMGHSSSCFEGVHRPKKLVLQYFPISGRAEPIRLALVLGKLRFEDRRIPGSDWEKEKTKMPYAQVPVLVVDSKPIPQTKAILRYVGKLATYQGKPLYPKDPLVAAKVDGLLDAFDDLWILIAPSFRIKDQSIKERERQALFEQYGPAAELLQVFENTLSQSKNGYAVPEAGLSVADLMCFCFLNTIRSGFVEGLTPELLRGYRAIMKHKEKIAKLPEVSSYYKDGGRSNPMGVPFYEVFQPGR